MSQGHVLVQRMAAFTDGNQGGNPAGIAITDVLPHEAVMQRIAADVGASETAFAARHDEAWRVRYFSPETEIPFCGHATIALAASLGEEYGFGDYDLRLNHAMIRVSVALNAPLIEASLQSPPTKSSHAPVPLLEEVLPLFNYTESDLDDRLAPALAHAGANHLIVPLRSRGLLAAMRYDLDKGRKLMRANDLVTIAFVYSEAAQLFHARNAFASGGVLEDPATGAAAAALAGYLRDSHWPHGGQVEIIQGEDMGARSRLRAELTDVRGSSIRVIGSARPLSGPQAYEI